MVHSIHSYILDFKIELIVLYEKNKDLQKFLKIKIGGSYARQN